MTKATPIYEELAGGVHIVTLPGSSIRMTPILQRGTSVPWHFRHTVEEAQEKGGFDVCINAQWYDLSLGTTGNEGIAVLGTGERYGSSFPSLWSVSQTSNYKWVVQYGDPPSNAYTGIGGLCPLVVDNLKYGENNQYSLQLVNSVPRGEPLARHRQFLTQRSSARFAALNIAKNKGKAGFGILLDGSIVVIVEQDDTAKLTYYEFRELFVERNCIHAMGCDGSDSVFLYYDNTWEVSASFIKNNTQTSGLGFRIDG